MSYIRQFTLQFVCPVTGNGFPVATKGDTAYIVANWRTALPVECPHCKKTHEFFFKNGFISGSLDMTLAEEHFSQGHFK